MKQSRSAGFVIITLIYIAAIAIGIAVFLALPDMHIFLRVLAGDVAATVFVFLTGVIVKNTTVYDAYWSVAPIVVLTGVAVYFDSFAPGVILLLAAVWYWGVRLTCNWAYTFENLEKQDWRYDKFKAMFPRAFQIVSFLGINMFPTLIVYLCLLPGIVFIEVSQFNALTVVGFLICFVAATLQLVADIQMQKFRKNAKSTDIIRVGLWKHSRHPNYLGEIMMWWGVYVIMLSAASPMWGLAIGAAANTCLFLFISIPLADKRNKEIRHGFDEYVSETNSLLPFVIKEVEEVEEIEEG